MGNIQSHSVGHNLEGIEIIRISVDNNQELVIRVNVHIEHYYNAGRVEVQLNNRNGRVENRAPLNNHDWCAEQGAVSTGYDVRGVYAGSYNRNGISIQVHARIHVEWYGGRRFHARAFDVTERSIYNGIEYNTFREANRARLAQIQGEADAQAQREREAAAARERDTENKRAAVRALLENAQQKLTARDIDGAKIKCREAEAKLQKGELRYQAGDLLRNQLREQSEKDYTLFK